MLRSVEANQDSDGLVESEETYLPDELCEMIGRAMI